MSSSTVVPNLGDDERMRATFSWDEARAALDGLPGGTLKNTSVASPLFPAFGPSSRS